MPPKGRSGQRISLPGPTSAERSARELRLIAEGSKFEAANQVGSTKLTPKLTEALSIPGEAVAFGLRFQAEGPPSATAAAIRNWRPGDRVTLRYSSGPRKIKEVLDRLRISGIARSEWPVIEWMGQIVWMKGVEVQAPSGLSILCSPEDVAAVQT